MRILNTLPRELKKCKKWYHQHFDGSPLFVSTIAEAELKREGRKSEGMEGRIRVCVFKNRIADWYIDMEDINRGSKIITALAKRDSRISTRLLAKWKHDEKEFQRLFERVKTLDMKNLSDKQLRLLFRDYYKKSIRRFSSSSIIDHFALGTDTYIADMMRKELGGVARESQFTEIFSIATAPVYQSFINKAEMDLLKIAIESPRDMKSLAAYQKKYFWVRNNYVDSYILDVSYFKKEIEAWKKTGADLFYKYEQLKNQARLNVRKKQALFKKYKFSHLLRVLLKISEDFTLWQDERKKATYLNIYMGMRILEEMARRRGRDKKLICYLILPEVEKWFANSLPLESELQKRARGCAFIASRKGYRVYAGSHDILKVNKILFCGSSNDTIDDIRGLSASVGRVIGKVRVIDSAREIGKVQQGDILVAVMTRPDYIAGIKKAAALVTNEGGITCHAAIVSRELGIPCIIGTKIATEVLKDGDMVEVNANHGVVTILKRQ